MSEFASLFESTMNYWCPFLQFVTPLNWLVWGVGSIVVADLAFIFSIIVFEFAAANAQSATITYRNGKTRSECVTATYQKISRKQQFLDVMWTLLGPTAWLNAVMSAIICSYFFPVSPQTPLFPSLAVFLRDLVLLCILADFFLYWGHRVQHSNEFLWAKCHSYHHRIDTPTALSTASIDSLDGTLQGGLPVILAGLLLSPHPITFYTFEVVHFLDNVMNHCGISTAALVNGTIRNDGSSVISTIASALAILTFKGAGPVRAGIEHHDCHHKYSNYTQNAKNFGEFFTVWDHLFGTFSKASLRSTASRE